MTDNRFYVYEFIKVETGEPFYVGKGCGDRYKDTVRGRNKWFKNIINKHEVVSRIIVDNLSETEAYEAEVWYIYEYKHIFNYELVNQDDGGQGACSGKANPMYGLKGKDNPNYGKKRTESIRKQLKNRFLGKPKTEEHKKKLRESIQTKRGGFLGANNPNYGKGENIKGGKNPASVKVKLTDKNGLTTIFETKKEACEKLSISSYLLGNLIGKTINVENDFSRMKDKYIHLKDCQLDYITK